MFNRQSSADLRTIKTTAATPPPFDGITPTPVRKPEPLADTAAAISIIGSDLTIMGERLTIITRGTLQLDGEVKGDLHGAEIVIGENGRVTGTVWGDHVSVRGHVTGTIRGRRVELLPKAQVEGEIHNETLTISEGALFDGRVKRPRDPAELTPLLDPAAHASSGHAGPSTLPSTLAPGPRPLLPTTAA